MHLSNFDDDKISVMPQLSLFKIYYKYNILRSYLCVGKQINEEAY